MLSRLIIRKLLKRVWYSAPVTTVEEECATPFLENLYFKSNSKNALVSFITNPFTQKEHFFYHTNRIECKIICDILDELDYNVDLVDCNNAKFTTANSYDLIIGFGDPIEGILKRATKDYKLILYRNGCDSHFSDLISIQRLLTFYNKYKLIAADSAPIYPTFKLQAWFADSLIVLGNKFVANTFKNQTAGTIYSADLFYFDVGSIDISTKDFSFARKNVIWFGSYGAIRKGLDITIEFFRNRPDLNLYICGLSPKETIFREAFATDLALPNIHDIGFVKMESKQFDKLIQSCGALLFPTCWEGGGGAVLNLVAAGGLVPIVTENLGLDFDGDEFLIEDFTPQSIEDAVTNYLQLDDEQLEAKARRLMHFIREKHSEVGYKQRVKQLILQEVT